MTERIRIEGPPESLDRLRRELLDEVGDGIDVQPISSAVPGELREPILTGLAVMVPPSVAIVAVCSVIERYMGYRERMAEIRLFRGSGDQEVSVADLRGDDRPK